MLEVRLAGGFELRVDGAQIALPASRRARAVLAYLALNPAPQPRGRLAARFWPDVLDESARASLRVALTELRQALGPAAGYVVATRDTVALEGPDLRVDAREFQRGLDEGDVGRALEACGAPILDGFDEEWAIEAREEHAHRLAGALESAAAAALDPAEAVRLTRAEIALDPLAEAPNRRLIAAARRGRRPRRGAVCRPPVRRTSARATRDRAVARDASPDRRTPSCRARTRPGARSHAFVRNRVRRPPRRAHAHARLLGWGTDASRPTDCSGGGRAGDR